MDIDIKTASWVPPKNTMVMVPLDVPMGIEFVDPRNPPNLDIELEDKGDGSFEVKATYGPIMIVPNPEFFEKAVVVRFEG